MKIQASLCLFLIILIGLINLSQSFGIHRHHSDEKLNKDPDITRYPVILVPGDGGNQLYAKLNRSSSVHYFCQLKTSDYFELWLNLEEITPYVIDCLVENLKLNYNNQTKETLNSDGVDIRIKGFGQTDTVEYIDSSKLSLSTYFGLIVNALVTKAKYVRGVNVRGAPYDWRKAPDELHEYYKSLTQLVEETYEMNNQTRIMLVAHSMGNPVSLYWMNNYVTQEWKDKYIRYFVSLSPPWGGAIKPLRLMASGDNIDVIIVRPLAARPYQRSAPSTAFLMPSYNFWGADEVLVSRPKRNYTVYDYEAFFNDIKFPEGYELYKKTTKLINDLQPPFVETHTLYGVDLKTPAGFVYKKESDFPDAQPAVLYGDGDGTVNKRSLLGYQRWLGKQKQPIYFKEFSGVEHVATLKHPDVIAYILSLLNS